MAAVFSFCMMTPNCFSEKCTTEETLSYYKNDNGWISIAPFTRPEDTLHSATE